MPFIANFSTSEELLLSNARNELAAALSPPNDQPYSAKTLGILRFSARHETLRRRYIAHEEVVRGLMHALKRTVKDRNENLFLLVMDSLNYLVNDGEYHLINAVECTYSSLIDDHGINVINQLTAGSGATETGQTRLLLALEAKGNSVLWTMCLFLADLRLHKHLAI